MAGTLPWAGYVLFFGHCLANAHFKNIPVPGVTYHGTGISFLL